MKILRRILTFIILVAIGIFSAITLAKQRVFFEAPIVLDLDDNGINFIDLESSKTFFDINNHGSLRRKTAWIIPGDGFLVIDKNKNGRVDNSGEFFGKSSANVDGAQELKKYDQNDDGELDKSDPIFSQLKIWQDLDSNGISAPEELTSLEQNGITSINFSLPMVINKTVEGNLIRKKGFFKKSGENLNLMSIKFDSNPDSTSLYEDYTMNPDLPHSLGYGELRPLQIAMKMDLELMDMVTKLGALEPSEYETIDERVSKIIYQWARVPKMHEKIHETAEIKMVQKVSVILKMHWEIPKDVKEDPNSSLSKQDQQLNLLNNVWLNIVADVKNRLTIQGTFHKIFAGAKYDFTTNSIQYGDLTYMEILNRVKLRYAEIDKKYQQEFINQIRSVLKNIAQNEEISGLDKNKIDQDLEEISAS